MQRSLRFLKGYDSCATEHRSMVMPHRAAASVSIIQDGRSTDISSQDDIVTVASSPLVLVVPWSNAEGSVEIDGACVKPVRQGRSGILSLDFSRSVGFHHLRIGRDAYAFATEDSKARIAGVLAMISALRDNGLSFGRQLFFADGSSISDERADFTWLWRWLPDIARTVEEIANRPLVARTLETKQSDHIGGRLDVPATLRLLRRDRTLVEYHEAGILRAGEGRYQPRKVVLRRSKRTADTVENRRVVLLAQYCIALARTLQSVRASGSGQMSANAERRSRARRTPTLMSIRGSVGVGAART